MRKEQKLLTTEISFHRPSHGRVTVINSVTLWLVRSLTKRAFWSVNYSHITSHSTPIYSWMKFLLLFKTIFIIAVIITINLIISLRSSSVAVITNSYIDISHFPPKENKTLTKVVITHNQITARLSEINIYGLEFHTFLN